MVILLLLVAAPLGPSLLAHLSLPIIVAIPWAPVGPGMGWGAFFSFPNMWVALPPLFFLDPVFLWPLGREFGLIQLFFF